MDTVALKGDLIIADTNVISYMLKGTAVGLEYTDLLAPYDVHIAFATRAELLCWGGRRNWGSRRREELRLFLRRFPVVPYEEGIAEEYARIVVQRERMGRPLDWPDAWI